MTIPNLPTDSLYKFFTLGSIAIVIISIYFIADYATSIDKSYKDYRFDVAILNHEIENNTNKVEEIVNKIELKCLKSGCNCNVLIKPDYSIEKSVASCLSEKNIASEIYELYNQIRLLQEILELKKIEVNAKEEQLLSEEKTANTAKETLWLFFSIGFLLFILGVSLWYLKLQRYQDIILKSQALEINKSNSVENHKKNKVKKF